MKSYRFLFAASLLIMLFGACKKDNFESGPFELEASDFLSAKKYKGLVLEIAFVNGHQPTNEAVNHLIAMMTARLNKPDGITVVYTTIASPRKSSYSLEDIRDVEKDQRTKFTKKDKLAAFVFFADAPYVDANVLGIAYSATSAAIFETRIEEYSGGVTQPPQHALEATVLEHEFGHLFGLVDNGSSMVTAHMDVAHPNHCDNQNCLMYYGAETIDIAAVITGGNIPQFDEHCLADLRAAGGK